MLRKQLATQPGRSLLMRPGRNMFSGAPEDMSSINNKKNKNMDIYNKIDSLFEDKMIQEALRKAEILFGSRWEKLPSPCSKEEFRSQFPQFPEHAYVVTKVCWNAESNFYVQ